MEKYAINVVFKAKPGKRDEVKGVWEQLVKPHAAQSDTLEFSCYCYSQTDEDTIVLFEVLSSPQGLEEAQNQPWFQQYMAELEPLLAAPPQFIPAVPIWVKK